MHGRQMVAWENRLKGTSGVQERLIDKHIISGILEGYTALSYQTHELMLDRIQELEKSMKELKEGLSPRKIDNSIAEDEIKSYIIQQKRAGITKIRIIDLIDTLKLPAEQIEGIMNKLKSNGVKEA